MTEFWFHILGFLSFGIRVVVESVIITSRNRGFFSVTDILNCCPLASQNVMNVAFPSGNCPFFCPVNPQPMRQPR